VEEGTVEKVEVKVTDQEKARLLRVEARPPLSEILNLHDFEVRYGHRNPASPPHLTAVQGDRETHNARKGMGVLLFRIR
jgi:hypothetical protein